MSASWPWIKFFPRDWLDNQRLKLCSLGARGLWITMLALMYEAVPPGRLKCTVEELARLVEFSQERTAYIRGIIGPIRYGDNLYVLKKNENNWLSKRQSWTMGRMYSPTLEEAIEFLSR